MEEKHLRTIKFIERRDSKFLLYNLQQNSAYCVCPGNTVRSIVKVPRSAYTEQFVLYLKAELKLSNIFYKLNTESTKAAQQL